MKDCPTVAVAVAALVITGVLGLTVKVSVNVPVPPALLAESVIVVVPAVVGVPEITPVFCLILNPVGRLAVPKEVGVLLAVMV